MIKNFKLCCFGWNNKKITFIDKCNYVKNKHDEFVLYCRKNCIVCLTHNIKICGCVTRKLLLQVAY